MVPDIAVLKRNKQACLNGANSATPSPESGPSYSNNYRQSNRNNHLRQNNENMHQNGDDGVKNYQTQKLPINLVKNQLLTRIQQNDSIIIIGETGCGKTTQIPKFLYEYNQTCHHQSTMIGITQPRRVAAISIATRVASEMRTQVGELVGYTIRFEDNTSSLTRIKYMTDGILLREAISDPLLTKYQVIILDEAHERTVHTDILFGVVKKAIRLRNSKRNLNEVSLTPLKLIIMSATMDVDHFSNYFNNAPVYYVVGRTFPIETFYAQEEQSDYILAALTTIFQIHQQEDELRDQQISTNQMSNGFTPPIGGDILVFCTGQEEIESMIKTVTDLTPQLNNTKTTSGVLKTIKSYPLYAALPTSKQQLIFKRSPMDCFRRVIFATNIAETSVTIPNIRYVVDSGKMKCRTFSSKTGFDVMKVENISKAQAAQRSGRAGRLATGNCYRLYTKQQYKKMTKFPVAEIQKCNLSSIILQMIAIGIRDVKSFDFVDPPPPENIECSLSQLKTMNAIETITTDNREDHREQYNLTPIGTKMVTFPVDPRFASLIIASQQYRCTDEILIIISMLSVDNVFYVPSAERETALLVHKKFNSSEGDLVKLLNVFRRFKEAKQSIAWCQENYLKPVQLKMAVEIRRQLMQLCTKVSIPMQSSTNTEQLRRCLTIGAGVGVGLGANIAMLQKDGNYSTVDVCKTNTASQPVYIHPSSCLFHCSSKPEFVLFVELIQTSKNYMRNISLVDQSWLLEATTTSPSTINSCTHLNII